MGVNLTALLIIAKKRKKRESEREREKTIFKAIR